MDTLQGKRHPYTVTRLLGKGKGGYSYLAQGSEGPVVVKQIHHEPCSYYQFGDKLQSELRDYRTLSALGIPMAAPAGGGRSAGTAGEAVHPRPNGVGTAANGYAAAASRRADAGAVPPFGTLPG